MVGMERNVVDMETSKNIFGDLEGLGFDNLENLSLYDKKEEKHEEVRTIHKEKVNEEVYLYDKKVICPVCGNEVSVRVVKTNAPRIEDKESDFFIRYKTIVPYFYDVWLCNVCGYASMKSDFDKIKKNEIERVQNGISKKWTGKKYPRVYDAEIAIERYKISLLNYTIMESKASQKALNCLKIAWIYRLLEDTNNERIFMEQAVLRFNEAYLNEDFPIYRMNKFTIMYLIGELHRRLGNNNEAIRQFSSVIIAQNADPKIKDLALDQKHLIKEVLDNNKDGGTEKVAENNKKEGFFARFFK